MRKTVFFIFALLSVFFTFQAHAQEVTPQVGWAPKWSVGDWWVVEMVYNLKEFDTSGMMNEDIWQIVPVKYSVVSEEDLDGERVYKIEIRPSKKTTFGSGEYDLWISRDNLQVRKIKEDPSEMGAEYIFDRQSYGFYIIPGNLHLYAFPLFPLPNTKKQQKVKFKRKTFVQGEWREYERWVWGGQASELIDLTSLSQDEKINKEFLQGSIYKVAINGNEVIQYWSKDLPWWVYYIERGIKGYLREYHISAGK